ncbi:proopiomelanocortin a [Rhinoraja longicauda]
MMRRLVWGQVLLALLPLWAATSGQLQDCLEHSKCLELPVPKMMECLETCRADTTLESPIYPGNSYLQPIEENIRNYVMGHFRWSKFGKKRGNSTGFVGSKREGERARALVVQIPTTEPEAPEVQSEDMARQFPKLNYKRSYSIEHFRWGKPMGKKRRPIKVYPNNELAANMGSDLKREESVDYPAEMSDLGDAEMQGDDAKKDGKDYKMNHFRWGRGPKGSGQGWGPEPLRSEPLQFGTLEDILQEGTERDLPEEEVKKDGKDYKFGHFRWSAPLKGKRYGGFMKSWDQRGHKPLLALFRNVIIKDGRDPKAQSQWKDEAQ